MEAKKPLNTGGNKIPEALPLLGMVLLAFVVIFVADNILAFFAVSILRLGGRSFTVAQTQGISIFVTRISGLIATIVCFKSFTKNSRLSGALGGGLAALLGASMMASNNPDVPKSSVWLLTIIGVVVGAARGKSAPKVEASAGGGASAGP